MAGPTGCSRAGRPRVACIGGGPGGLFTAVALAHAVPGASLDVFERNSADDVFGFGVVFSDATLDNIDRVDPVLHAVLDEHGHHWDTIRVHSQGVTTAASGNGMSAVHRRVLLDALRSRATRLGARLHFATPVDVDDLAADGDYDLIVAADGTNSATRDRFSDRLGHSVSVASVKFIWFGTTYEFDGLTFLHKRSRHGNFAVHAYPIGPGLSTFIVETDEDTWRRAGLDGFDTAQPPGRSDETTQRYLEDLFADEIGGHPLVANNSRWANFHTRRTDRWHTRTDSGTPLVLLGDAVHTAHFSVGSGTKMAMEDAAALAGALARERGLEAALVEFEHQRVPQVAKIQNSAVPSLSWWDHFGTYQRSLEPWQFGFHFFSRAISTEKMRLRDPGFVEGSERAWLARHGTAPIRTPLRVGAVTLKSRLLQVHEDRAGLVRIGDGRATLTARRITDGRYDDADLPLFAAPERVSTTLEPATIRALDELCDRHPDAVVVHGGNPLSAVLCAEHVRMIRRIPAVVVAGPATVRARRAVDDQDCAATLILSGRVDAVAFAASPWRGDPERATAVGAR